MRKEFRELRLQQLERSLSPFQTAKQIARPQRGWIRSIRQALGISASELAQALESSRQLPLQLENAEAKDTITLKSLRKMARALDCELVYALVPIAGTLDDIRKNRLRARAEERVLHVEHSMALEDQAAGHLEEAIATEIRRLAKNSGAQR